MAATPNMQSNWADVSPLDADTDKILNSLLTDPYVNSSNDDAGLNPSSFAGGWPALVNRSLGDNNSFFGLSPSAPLGVSPGLASFYDQGELTKAGTAWPSASDYTAGAPSAPSSMASTYLSYSDAMHPSLSQNSTQTPSDAHSLQSDMVHPLGTIPSSVSLDDIMDLNDHNKDNGSTPNLSPASVISNPSPLVPNNTLNGYHCNIASDHAQHLADLVKTSTILNAGHPGPRSLASSLSRSVLNVDSIGRPDVLSSNEARCASTHGQNKGLTIQQRRRLSHMDKPSGVGAVDDASAQVPQADRSGIKGHQRQNSAPDPVFPPLGSSPEISKTPLVKQRRPHRASVSHTDPGSSQLAGLPSTADDADAWIDAVVTNSHDLVFVLSLKGTVLYMSPSVQRILGFHSEEIVGRPLADFTHPADIGPFSRELKEAITLPNGDDEGSDAENCTAVKANRRVDLVMRMACKNGTFSLIATTGRVSVDPPKHRKVVVCSGRPQSVPMLPWNDVREGLLTSDLSAWLKISHNGIFLGSTGPIQQILGIENVNLLGRHVRDLPMVTSSSDLLDALKCGRSISVQDHYDGGDLSQRAPVKLTVYPWTSNGRSNSVSFVHVQQLPAQLASDPNSSGASTSSTTSLAKRKLSELEAQEAAQGSGSLSGSAMSANGSHYAVMTAGDAANTVFSELTGFHSGSWLIEMQKLHNANKRLRHELSALRKRSTTATFNADIAAAC
ncbi:related to white collar 1 protein [Melanopsichium pennsylvanicum]|uniref:Related to white collar 1 protein n=2 Tax=Melanopsichium pennsylvanicum TaxID=63383 RepID=A0AAJ4XNW8_9BASI|nr:related to white collar 1 protein [Melanopsichium pennsylvanicum 4]SNX85608.1 related to white collar 1 protein [Melanopsichium pennsylvanicum]